MGTCAGKEHNPYDLFNVTNINDDHRLVHSGVMYVTETDLIYIDKKSRDRWEWPLTYLRRYGCEGYVFSFEAGRKCPSGEGLYAFNCKRANALFNEVARRIVVLPSRDIETSERKPTDIPFPPKTTRSSSSIPNGTAPSQPLSSSVTASDLPPPLPPTPPSSSNQNGQSNVNYTHLHFDKDLSDKPPPQQVDQVNYTQIDMPKTNEIIRFRQNIENGGITRHHTVGSIQTRKKKPGSRNSSTSSTSSLTGDQQSLRMRGNDDNPRRGSMPDVRTTGQQRFSPPLLPATVTEAPSENEPEPHKPSMSEPNYLNLSIGPENQHTYSNMNIGTTLEPEQNYANIKVGGEERNYTNVAIGGGVEPIEITHHTTTAPTTRPSVSGVESEHNYSNISVGGPVIDSSAQHNHPAVDSEHNYTNVTIGTADSEHNYTNISVGVTVEESHVSSSSAINESNYQNLIPGQGLVNSTPVTTPTQKLPQNLSPDPGSPSFVHPRSNTFNHPQIKTSSTPNTTQTLPSIKGGGNTMQTYIELDINNSVPTSSYAELQIGDQETTTLSPISVNSERQRSQSAIVTPAQQTAQDDTQDTLYKELNFKEMEALHLLVKERQHLKAGDSSSTISTHMESDKDQKKHKSKK